MTVLKFIKKIIINKLINKTKVEISGLGPDYFRERVWPGMASLCGLFLCVIAGNFITC